MSDFELDDELLALTEPNTHKRKRSRDKSSKSSRSKRAKHDMSGSEDEALESEDDMNPYPLEGKYKDEEDREHLLEMPEIEREQILADRAEELQKIEDRKEIRRLTERNSSDAAGKAIKRTHSQRGTKEKRDKLDEYKAKRQAKSDKKQKADARRDSDSGEDMETSDSDNDDPPPRRKSPSAESIPKAAQWRMSLDDVKPCFITRDAIAKNYGLPWFDEWIQGSYVRYLIGSSSTGSPEYRFCEVVSVLPHRKKEGYSLEHKTVYHDIELKHGKATRAFLMDKVSNSLPSDREFDRWINTCKLEDVSLPNEFTLIRKAKRARDLGEEADYK
ncbi:hypothetical protein DL96DRAFT_458849 [Flagelloscypha sp. PMI_526]|nr:hypothetical protein DL96DRAFT_458849 [Flagelloscypha sp. PMI_526]